MSADEFDVIRTLFAPLAKSDGARGLIDDVAVLETRGKLIVTTDAIVEGVHFFPGDPIDTVAKKALRVNLSDLAAKGATCVGVLLTLIWPDGRTSSQLAEFARGLGEDLQQYGVPLLGGDTTSTPGLLTISITAFGTPLGERVPARADAKAGEDVWVTGTIGDAWVGLNALREMARGAEGEGVADAFSACVQRYRLPQPRTSAATTIATHASAAMDVSDGLIQDAGKLAAASGVRMRLVANDVPVSREAHAWLERSGAAISAVNAFAGGDDYEILFTAPPTMRHAIEAALVVAKVAVTRIGVVEPGQGVVLVDRHGAELKTCARGYSHKLGS